MARADGLSGPLPPRGRPGGGSGQGAGGQGGRGSATGRRRPPRRLRLIFAGFLLLVLVEILILIAAFRTIGPWWTIGLLILFSVAGAFLVRRESGRTWRALRQAVDSGLMPARELADASLVLVGGLFLLLPGFLSDLVGIFLILPMTRSLSRRLFALVIGSRVVTVMPEGMMGGGTGAAGSGPGATGAPGHGPRRGPTGGDIIEGEIISEDPPER
ncbi:FxsA family protein [Ornithinimicrobium ciconiae]|uniref:FxsA family protein n=1 Tax=Ornithinimicrobium ciconiae TaxID=2594265 RepID=A0A516GB67_9MICO|nr:FxsA family protein [Ornithinimicrobium ciconiae]QDO88742.1 FxsA family protein [Ornithinimicrobium ciconiae]